MKLSLKLQDESPRSPLFKAKIPSTVFSQPFTSAVSANLITPQDPSFSLSTNYSSGPSASLFLCLHHYNLTFLYLPQVWFRPLWLSTQFPSHLLYPVLSFPHKPNYYYPLLLYPFQAQFGHFSLFKTPSSNTNPRPNSGSHDIPEANSDSGSRSNGQFGDWFVRDGWQEVKLEPSGSNDNGDVKANPDYNGMAHLGLYRIGH